MSKPKTTFKKICRLCDEIFIAETKFTTLCDSCFYKQQKKGVMKSKRSRKKK